MAEKIPTDRRRNVFAALVAAQNAGVDMARRRVAARYGLTTKTMEKIEQEGLDAHWPPLGAEARIACHESGQPTPDAHELVM